MELFHSRESLFADVVAKSDRAAGELAELLQGLRPLGADVVEISDREAGEPSKNSSTSKTKKT